MAYVGLASRIHLKMRGVLAVMLLEDLFNHGGKLFA